MIKHQRLEGCFIIDDWVFKDERGCFFESYNQDKLNKLLGYELNFVQDNISFSVANTLRGLHFQRNNPQGKLIRVLQGRIMDVAVDLRRDSKTYGQWIAVELHDKKAQAFYIPPGFAHGFYAFQNSLVTYKCTTLYDKDSDGGINAFDETLGIQWPSKDVIISNKDVMLPKFKEVRGF